MIRKKDIRRLVAINTLIAASGVVATSQVAWVFGATRDTDIWFMAAGLTTGIFGLLQSGQLSEFFLPDYVRIKHEKGPQKAYEAYCVVLNWTVLAALLLTVLCYATSGYLLEYYAKGFQPAERARVLDIFSVLLPLLPLQLLGAVQQMLGNAEKKFGQFEIGPLVGSLAGIAIVAILHSRIGLWSLAASQWVIIFVSVSIRQVQLHDPCRKYRFRWACENYSVLRLVRQLGHTAVNVVATQAYTLTFRAMLGTLPSGVLSAYTYAELLYVRTSSLFIRPVGTVYYSALNTALAASPHEAQKVVRTALSRYLDVYFAIIAAGLPAVGHGLRALWGSHKYDGDLISVTEVTLLLFFCMMLVQMHSTVTRKLNLVTGFYGRQYTLLTIVQILFVLVAVVLIPKFGIWGAVTTVMLNMACLASTGLYVAYSSNRHLVAMFSHREILLHLVSLIPAVCAGAVISRIMDPLLSPSDFTLQAKVFHCIAALLSAGVSLLLYKYIARLAFGERLDA